MLVGSVAALADEALRHQTQLDVIDMARAHVGAGSRDRFGARAGGWSCYAAAAVLRSPLARSSLLVSLASASCKPAAPEPPEVDTSIPAAPVLAAQDRALHQAEGPSPVEVYGYFRLPALDRAIPLVAEQLLPPSQRAVVNEPMMRMGLEMVLEGRGAVAQHLDLSRPWGCLVVSPVRYEQPLVCAVAYQGGLGQLVEDLGPSGFVSGDDDHAAYRFDAQSYYLVAMGDHVAFALAPELVAATRDRLRRDIIDAPVGPEELVLTAYPAKIFEDFPDRIMPVIEEMASSGFDDGVTPHRHEAQRKQWLSFGELEQVDLWIDLDGEADRTRFGYRGEARPGTPTEKAYAQQLGRGLDLELLSGLPADAMMIGGMSLDNEALMTDPMLGSFAQARASTGPDEVGAAVGEVFRRNMAAWEALSAGQAALAFTHEPGSKGGVLLAQRLVSSDDALPVVRRQFDGLDEALAGSKMPFRFELHKGAVRAGKVKGDVVKVVGGTEELRSTFQRMWGAPGFEMAFAQRGDVLYVAMAPTKSDRYVKRALAAAGGKGSVQGSAGAAELLTAHGGDSLVLTGSMAQVIEWMRALEIIDDPGFVPSRRHDDLVLSMRSAGERRRELVVDLSPVVLETIYRLQEGP